MEELSRLRVLELGRQAIHQEIEALKMLVDGLADPFWRCAQLLCKCQGLIWVTAVGTSAAVGIRFAHILTCCGKRSMFLSPSDGLHGHSGIIQAEDLLIAISRGGESCEVTQMAVIGNERGAKTIAFVHNTNSTLAQSCHYVVPIQSTQEYELMGYLATTSTVAFSAICDALCAIVLEASGYTPEKFAKTHPGGAVGQVLTSPNDHP